MPTVKTAVSLQRPLFDQVEAIARDMHIPRSRLFALALEDFVRRYESRQLVDRINAAYQDAPEPSEQDLLRHMRRQYQHLLEGEW